MENLTKREKEILIALIGDCVNYGFAEKEALTYIKARLGKEISKDAYYKRKKIE